MGCLRKLSMSTWGCNASTLRSSHCGRRGLAGRPRWLRQTSTLGDPQRVSSTSAATESRVDPEVERRARVDLAAAFRWTVRLNMHEAVANHFSAVVSEDGTRFLLNPNLRHFSRIKASDLLLLDALAPSADVLEGSVDAPDPTAWHLHSALHRLLPHARAAIHLHPKYTTVLAALQDSSMPAIDQNTAIFYNRVLVDKHYGGLALEEEGERCARLFATDPAKKVMVMGNHGVLVLGSSVADAFDRLYYFERAAETLITAYMCNKPLRILVPEIAEKTAQQIEDYPLMHDQHLEELKKILDEEEPEYRS